MMKKILLTTLSIALIGLGVSTLFAAPGDVSGVVPPPKAPGVVATTSPLDQSMSPENLRLLLLRMGYFYAGFICLLFALEFGIESKPKKMAQS